jgi:type IV pilus assembly protein PilY1
LKTALDQLFRSILTRTSSGSAAAVISSSRSGEGALYQAIFWPDKDSGVDDPDTGLPVYVSWTGEVHAFLVDKFGTLYLDTNEDGILQEPVDIDGDNEKEILDKPVVIYFDENLGETKGCIGHIESTDPTTTDDDEVVFFNDDGSCPAIEDLENFNYLWNTSDWLNSSAVNSNILVNRTVTDDVFSFAGENKNRRYIFTWEDLDNDGAVDQATEVLPFIENLGASGGMPDEVSTLRAPVEADFGVDMTNDPTHMANRIIKWIRGQDQGEETLGSLTFPAMRSREIQGDAGPYTWRLGDVIHSTPVTVAGPAENYQQLYRDLTYAAFADKYQYRRQMVYFGANDGMLHAVNGGFYRRRTDTATFDVNQKFCLTDACVITNGVEQNTDSAAELGTEMWAYVPYNLMPHLKCLTEPGYIGDEHKYFVDLRPRIFDVQIFNEEQECTSDSNLLYKHPDCIHPNGWGTILVGGMRFGGSPTTIDYLVDIDNDGTGEAPDNRIFTSAYFILDITNPEMPPVLLGEYTKTFNPDDGESPEVDLGYTTVISTMIPMK